MRQLLSLVLLSSLASCFSVSKQEPSTAQLNIANTVQSEQVAQAESSNAGGGYYLDDGPLEVSEDRLAQAQDAQVRFDEPILIAQNDPYYALGKRYEPYDSLRPYDQQGLASWYGKRYHGRPTASGEIYDMFAMTAAHPILPIPSYAKVTSLKNNRSVIVRINDRGPFLHNRIIDLSYAAAYRLDIIQQGVGEVHVQQILPADFVAQTEQNAGEDSIVNKQSPVISAIDDRQSSTTDSAVTEANQAELIQVKPARLQISDPDDEVISVAPSAGYGVQLGAFSVLKNAQKHCARINGEFAQFLSQADLSCQVLQVGRLQRTFIGYFPQKQAAVKVMDTVCSGTEKKSECGFIFLQK